MGCICDYFCPVVFHSLINFTQWVPDFVLCVHIVQTERTLKGNGAKEVSQAQSIEME